MMPPQGEKWWTYHIPLDSAGQRIALLHLPTSMTVDEAARVGRFVLTLAIDGEVPAAPPPPPRRNPYKAAL